MFALRTRPNPFPEAEADLQALEVSTTHARDAAIAAARENAPAELVEALARLREQQRALMVVDLANVGPSERRRQNERAAAVVSLMREIEAAIESPISDAQVDDLVNRARAAVYK
ncbi:MAG TPA: hypothetical protein PLQ12_08670 [Candidatus Defluviicoccus seviourii]|nr:hypothetical protein [Candidatus Defluviicoccus seviourii]